MCFGSLLSRQTMIRAYIKIFLDNHTIRTYIERSSMILMEVIGTKPIRLLDWT